jgi:hypothetical protein
MKEGRVRLALVEAEAVPREGLIAHHLVTWRLWESRCPCEDPHLGQVCC